MLLKNHPKSWKNAKYSGYLVYWCWFKIFLSPWKGFRTTGEVRPSMKFFVLVCSLIWDRLIELNDVDFWLWPCKMFVWLVSLWIKGFGSCSELDLSRFPCKTNGSIMKENDNGHFHTPCHALSRAHQAEKPTHRVILLWTNGDPHGPQMHIIMIYNDLPQKFGQHQ